LGYGGPEATSLLSHQGSSPEASPHGSPAVTPIYADVMHHIAVQCAQEYIVHHLSMQAFSSKLQQAMESRDAAAIVVAMQGAGPSKAALLLPAAQLLTQLFMAAASSAAPAVGPQKFVSFSITLLSEFGSLGSWLSNQVTWGQA